MNTNNKVYIISQSDAFSWSSEMEITHATLSRDKAKEILRDIISETKKEAKANGEEINRSITKQDIEDYIEELTDANRPEYSVCSDFCNWVKVWCDIVDVE